MTKKKKTIVDSVIRIVGHIDRLKLESGDTLVIQTDQILSAAQAEILTQKIRERFPGHEVLVLSNGLTLGVVGKTEAAP